MCFDYINNFVMMIFVLPSDLLMNTKIITVATRIKEQSDTINPKNLKRLFLRLSLLSLLFKCCLYSISGIKGSTEENLQSFGASICSYLQSFKDRLRFACRCFGSKPTV